jgi:DNA-binding GntR family transcriptional regulator
MTESTGLRLQPPKPSSSALQTRQSISGQIADLLRGEILSAAIGPNQPLKQDHIARRFEVSQAPVREALQQLASERLVVSQLNRGVRVAPLDRSEVEETAALRLKLELDLIELAAKKFNA